jgi:hypothetical protein
MRLSELITWQLKNNYMLSQNNHVTLPKGHRFGTV